MRTRYLLPLLLLTLACAKKEPPPPAPAVQTPVGFSVKAVTLGKALRADKSILQATDTFAASDTIYASVETEGRADKARLEAKWTFLAATGPTSIGENAMDLVGLTGPSVTEFHLAKRTGWPKGAYQVEVFLNGVSVQKKGFTVS